MHDLRALVSEEQEKEALRLATAEARAPFDLARGPLMRAGLVRLSDEFILLLTLHHIVSDAWSMGVLFRELSQLYEAFRAGAALAPPSSADPVFGLRRVAAGADER